MALQAAREQSMAMLGHGVDELRRGRGCGGVARRLAGVRRRGCAAVLAWRRGCGSSAGMSAVRSRGASKGAARDAAAWSMAWLGFSDVGVDVGLGQGGTVVI